ncbi:hemerythrin domain-containing protein [Pelagibacterium montanilacus]|uniref:hemerythrin domain-containing protein n=1 Tax=Pelagibacterium montanilacus TaxID=2185280 RepID=UPI000F8D4AD1|nr:hemerythrin domain-containing protein [Pelagibacterium montanilacus]
MNPRTRPVDATTPLEPERIHNTLSTIHRDQRAICDALEAIADALPISVDRQACLHAARALGPLITKAHQVEEEMIFPMISERWITTPGLDKIIERLKYEHFEDSCYAEEVQEALLSFVRGERRLSAEALGYMLRGFFEALRRHIAFEEDFLVPLFGFCGSRGRLN